MNENKFLEEVLIRGDLSKLNDADKLKYYNLLCTKLGLEPSTQPFDYIKLNGRLQLYAKKSCTDQLRKIHSVTISLSDGVQVNDVYMLRARASLPNGREDEEIGTVNIKNLSGDALANAIMKCSTKAKRRATLSIIGMGMLDETELETIPRHVMQLPPPKPIELSDDIDFESEIEKLIEQIDAKTKEAVLSKMALNPSKDEIKRIYTKLQTMRGNV